MRCFFYLQIIEELFVNKKMKSKLTQANIDPYSSEGRSEIYCRFVLEHPHDIESSLLLELEDLITAATAVIHMVAILLAFIPYLTSMIEMTSTKDLTTICLSSFVDPLLLLIFNSKFRSR